MSGRILNFARRTPATPVAVENASDTPQAAHGSLPPAGNFTDRLNNAHLEYHDGIVDCVEPDGTTWRRLPSTRCWMFQRTGFHGQIVTVPETISALDAWWSTQLDLTEVRHLVYGRPTIHGNRQNGAS